MNKWTRFSSLTNTVLATAGGCEPSVQQQSTAFSRDFFLQALGAYLL